METKDIPDVQLKELIDTINRDGVDKVRQESESLLRQAGAKADEIVAAARVQAAALLANARQEQERLEHSGRESLKQASRDLLLGVRKQLENLFSTLLKEKTLAALKEEEITAAIAAMISKWTPERQDKLELLLPQKQFDSMAKALRKAIADKIASGIEIKAAAEVTSGFRIAEKDGQSYFDFSAESIAANLALSLNPIMAKIMADALRQDM
jgi:V/A-type H+/Na+-transporting ATPase subunit E